MLNFMLNFNNKNFKIKHFVAQNTSIYQDYYIRQVVIS